MLAEKTGLASQAGHQQGQQHKPLLLNPLKRGPAGEALKQDWQEEDVSLQWCAHWYLRN